MSETPICDFVKEYAAKKALRFHTPGHKGKEFLGFEALDLTEIDGADSLFESSGIIRESESNASAIFGCPTFYSTEGSSLCIRAMLYLAITSGRGRAVLAARRIHKSFLSAAALLDFDVWWLYPEEDFLWSLVTSKMVEMALERMPVKPCCFYLTSPNYLGAMCDVEGIAKVCREHDVLLLVDCAHGAYLRFLEKSLLPTDLGADLCCTSAHKTLPVLTGGAYLHVGNAAANEFSLRVKEALALFASTSPSYLILQSLDAANRYLADYSSRLIPFLAEVLKDKKAMEDDDYLFCFGEPMKLALLTDHLFGFTGDYMAKEFEKQGIYPEYHDRDYIIFMPTPENGTEEWRKLVKALRDFPKRGPQFLNDEPDLPHPKRAMRIRDAVFSPSEKLPLAECEGRILHDPCVPCPPGAPFVMPGEIVSPQAVGSFRYYGISELSVVKQ